MKKTKSIFYLFCTAITACMCCIGGLSHCNLAHAADTNEDPRWRLQISPVNEYTPLLKPGDHYRSSYQVQNTGSEPVKFKVSATHYGVRNDSYEKLFEEAANTYTQMADWIQFDWTEGTIAPNGNVTVPYTINVPKDAPGGAQNAAIITQMVDDNAETQGTGVKPVYRLAYLLYAQIAGNTRETGSILENQIGSIFLNPPISATSVVENTGNTYNEMKDTLQVFDVFSNKELYSNAQNPTKTTLLPETRRAGTISWDDSPALGLFKVRHAVEYLGQQNVQEKVVLVCPVWLMILVGVLIVGLIIWIILRVRDRKKEQQSKVKTSTNKSTN